MSDGEMISIKFRLLDLFNQLDENELNEIETWISSQSYKKDLENKKNLFKSDKKLIKIGQAIKEVIPFEAEMQSESIHPPSVGDQADCNNVNTCHVDAFLYDEEEVEELVKKGKLKRSYCMDCHSRNVKDLVYISHSMSRESLQYIFKVLLPKDLENKQLLDVGSRLGAVLYGAYYFSNARTIIGIEINKECCDLQERIIDEFVMDTNRIKVMNSDVLERHDIVQQSDIIIVNVLDFFVDVEKHKNIWHFFRKYMRKGSYLVCNRSMADTLNSLDIFEEFMDWLSVCKPSQLENELLFDMEDCNELYLYKVN